MIQLWKYSHLHIVHLILNVDPTKLDNEWVSESNYGNISLRAMIIDFLRHFKLHLDEIDDLIEISQGTPEKDSQQVHNLKTIFKGKAIFNITKNIIEDIRNFSITG